MKVENSVWNILRKDNYTEEGIKKIEGLYDAIERLCMSSTNPKDIELLSDGINENLYEVMDILDELK